MHSDELRRECRGTDLSPEPFLRAFLGSVKIKIKTFWSASLTVNDIDQFVHPQNTGTRTTLHDIAGAG